MNDGVKIILARMDTNPEEFYMDEDKWKFVYKEYFRDSMSEEEKGAIFDKLKVIRREELTAKVMKTLFEAEEAEKDEEDEEDNFVKYTQRTSPFSRYTATQADVNMANKLGIPLTQYLKEKSKL